MLRVHFLNVGHGDCTILEFPSGNLTVVDVNLSSELLTEELVEIAKALGFKYLSLYARGGWSLDQLATEFKEAAGLYPVINPVDYLTTNFPGRSIFRFIATHPHMDHLSGLADIIARMHMWNIWYVAGGITIDDFDTSRYRREDWDAYQSAIASTSNPKAISPNRGDLRDFWQQDGIEIWSPSLSLEQEAESSNDPNLASYVLCVRHGDAVVVLGADADVASWETIYLDRAGEFPKVTVLKASHHGRKTGYHQPSVKAMSPDLTVVSVGKKPPNDASQLYAQYSEAVWSTRHHGNIVLTISDDGVIDIESDRTRHDDLASRDAISLSVKMTINTIVASAVASAMTARAPRPRLQSR